MRLVGFVSFLQEPLNEFFAKVRPESGRVFDPEGKHKDLTDIANNFRHFWVMMDDDQEIIRSLKAYNRAVLKGFKEKNESVVLIESDHKKTLDRVRRELL